MSDILAAKNPTDLVPGPTDQFTSDGGEFTQRNFRYQHAFGVILLIAAYAGKKNYTALWCEQHEDFLGERTDGLYDGYQVKSRKPEIGPWTLSTDDLRKSIRRFVRLVHEYPSKIADLYFVSNTCMFETSALDEVHRSPSRLLNAVKSDTPIGELPLGFRNALASLSGYCECGDGDLAAVLRKVQFVAGPDRDGFDAVVAHEHLPQIEKCKSLTPVQLNALRDELIQLVFEASSLKVTDPSRHWCCPDGSGHPRLKLKRIPINRVGLCLSEINTGIPLRFAPSAARLRLESENRSLSALEQKLAKGGLANQIHSMKRRALSAESHLMEIAHAKPDEIDGLIDQLEGIVQGECDEALLDTFVNGKVNGPKMLKSVYKRLRQVAEKEPRKVNGESYEALIGLAGLLSDECKIWWSEEFELRAIS